MPLKKSKKKLSKKCKSGKILRKSYKTKKGVKVKASCIKDQGKKGKGPKTLPKIPRDIAEVLSDVNVSTEHTKPEFVNKIANEYKADYGTRVNTIVKKESPKKKHKIKLSIDNDYIRKSSDNLENVNSPRSRPEL